MVHYSFLLSVWSHAIVSSRSIQITQCHSLHLFLPRQWRFTKLLMHIPPFFLDVCGFLTTVVAQSRYFLKALLKWIQTHRKSAIRLNAEFTYTRCGNFRWKSSCPLNAS